MFDDIIDRKGTYCTQWDYVQDRFGEEDLLPFTISDTDFAIPQEVWQSLARRMQHPVFGYTRWNHQTFKSSVTGWYKERFNVVFDEEWLLYSPTVIYSVSKLIELKSSINEGVIVQTPAYDAFFKVIIENKRQLVENPLIYENGRYTIDFQDLEEKMAQTQNKVLLLCSPHNPTGRVWTKDELKKIVDLCEQYDIFLISDEIHMDIIRNGLQHHPILEYCQKNVALVTSGSKTFNFPGLIFSYLIVPDEKTREAFNLLLKNRDGLSSTSTLGLEATMTAYQHSATWVDELNHYLEKNLKIVQDFFTRELPEIKVIYPESTYLVWLDISQLNLPMSEIQERLVHIGRVAIMDGSIYGGNGKNFLRLNIGCSKAKVLDGLNRVSKSLR